MTDSKGGEDGNVTDNIFEVADELARQVDLTKKLVLVFIVALILSFVVVRTAELTRALHLDVVIGVAFVVVGVWQWIVLSRWTQRYRTYKALQRKINSKLDFERETREKQA